MKITSYCIFAWAFLCTAVSANDSALYKPQGREAWDFWFAKSGENYHAFYLQTPKGVSHDKSSVGSAFSKDLIHWTENGEILHANTKGQWCDSHIATGSTWRGKDRWQMLFTAITIGKGGGIGLAESDDLKKWNTVGPVCINYKDHVVPEDPYWQKQGVKAGDRVRYEIFADPYVLPDAIDGWYYMIANCGIVGRPINERGCIGLMRSKDGRTWEDCGIIGLMLNFDRPETPQLWKHGNRWYLYFGGAREQAKFCRVNCVYKAQALRGPFAESPHSEIKLPDGRPFYIAKVLTDPQGQDVLLACISGSQLSMPYPVQYADDGSISLGSPLGQTNTTKADAY